MSRLSLSVALNAHWLSAIHALHMLNHQCPLVEGTSKLFLVPSTAVHPQALLKGMDGRGDHLRLWSPSFASGWSPLKG